MRTLLKSLVSYLHVGYPYDFFILIFSDNSHVSLSSLQKDEDNIFHLKPQIRAISASSSGHSGFSSVDILLDSIALRIISKEGTA